VKLEWEVEPAGSPFDGSGTASSAASLDSGVAGATLSETQTGLAGSTPHHWRVRLLYDPVTTPLQQRSRWLTIPWGGWLEHAMRTAGSPAGRVPDGSNGPALRLERSVGGAVTLTWSAACLPEDPDYAIYEGELGDFESHLPRSCTTGGATTSTLTPIAGSAYYLVVPLSPDR
jgi:hypothetical protein